MNKSITRELAITITSYSTIVFLILANVIFSKGIILGGDWAIPYTHEQFNQYFEFSFYSWSDLAGLVGYYRSYMIDIPLAIFYYFLSFFFTGATISKIVLFMIYMNAAVSIYIYLKYSKLTTVASFIGGLLYILSPIFFNYTVMGWILVLLSMGTLPIYLVLLDISIKQRKTHFAILSAIVFTISIVQSTALIWFTIATLALGINYLPITKKRRYLIKRYIINVCIIYLILLGTNIHWIYNMVVFKDAQIYGSQNVLSSVSTGTWLKFIPSNIIKGWGTLFNASYETSYIKNLLPLSYILPLTSLAGILTRKKYEFNRLSIVSFLIFVIMLSLLGQRFIAKLPFANIIRDPGRMIMLYTLGATILTSMFIDTLIRSKQLTKLIIILTILFINTHPFWLGKMYTKQMGVEDIRLRNYTYPNEFVKIENYLKNTNPTSKVLYFPLAAGINDYSKQEFSKPYQELSNLFANYSPRQGAVTITDKESAGINNYYYSLVNSIYNDYDDSIGNIIKTLNIEYIIFHFRNMRPNDWETYNKIDSSRSSFNNITREILKKSSQEIAIYKVINPSKEIELTTNIVNIDKKTTDIYKQMKIVTNSNLRYENNSPYIVNLEKTGINLKSGRSKAIVPSVNNQPDTLKYFLVRVYEKFLEYTKKNNLDKVDLLLWHASKRIAEYERYHNNVNKRKLLSDFHQYYELIKNTLVKYSSKEPNDPHLKSTIRTVYKQLVILNKNSIIETELNDFKNWAITTYNDVCSYCYYINVPSTNLYRLHAKGVSSISLNSKVIYNSEAIDDNDITTRNIELKSGGHLINVNPIRSTIVYIDNVSNSGISYDEFKKSINNRAINTDDLDLEQIPSFINLKHIKVDSIKPGLEYSLFLKLKKDTQDFELIVTQEIKTIRDKFSLDNKVNNIVYSEERILKRKINETEINLYNGLIEYPININTNAKNLHIYLVETHGDDNYIYNIEEGIENITLKATSIPELTLTTNSINTYQYNEGASLNFLKISPTKYVVKVNNSKDLINLSLKQRYDSNWNIYRIQANAPDDLFSQFTQQHNNKPQLSILTIINMTKNYFSNIPTNQISINGNQYKLKAIKNSKHYLLNGYSNGWTIQTENSKDNIYIIRFEPQAYTNKWLLVTVLTYIVTIVILTNKIVLHFRS